MMHRSMISPNQIRTRRSKWHPRWGFEAQARFLRIQPRAFPWNRSRAVRGALLVALCCSLFGSLGCASAAYDAAPTGCASEATEATHPIHTTEPTEATEPTQLTESTLAYFDRPPLYRVTGDAGADLIMLGTIHMGPENGWSLSPEATFALREASALVLELDPRQISEDAVGTMVANMIMLEPPGTTLLSAVRPKTAKLLEEMDSTVTAMGLPPSVRRHMKPWFVAAGLIESASATSGYPSSQSVENLILAELGDRPLIALETFQMQLRIFDNLSADLQDVMLYDTLLRLDETAEGIEKLVQAWRTADEGALEKIACEGIEELPKLELFYDHLLNDRNRNWITQLIPLLEDARRKDETILVGVGALHLVGPESVLSLLQKAGYSVSRIPQTKVKP